MDTKNISKMLKKYDELFESSNFFADIPRVNLGIWSAYKKLDEDGKEKFRKYMRNDDLKFNDIATLTYFTAKNAKDKIAAIKQRKQFEKDREEAYEWEQEEKQKILDEIEAESERMGFDPEYRHQGFDQELPEEN
jgi:hypothetical protein